MPRSSARLAISAKRSAVRVIKIVPWSNDLSVNKRARVYETSSATYVVSAWGHYARHFECVNTARASLHNEGVKKDIKKSIKNYFKHKDIYF